MDSDFLAKFEEILDRKFDEYAERTTRYLGEKFDEQHSRGVTSLSMHLYDMTSSLGNQINDILKETQDIKENNKVIFARFEYDESRISKLERIPNVG